jgi:hypothetical protein
LGHRLMDLNLLEEHESILLRGWAQLIAPLHFLRPAI